jgi:CheY-like chemotaxis protein
MKEPGRRLTMPILVVDDSYTDYESALRCFRKLNVKNPVYHCESGRDALALLRGKKSYGDEKVAQRPGIILLDLSLPDLDGLGVLREIKGDENLKSIPVVILTASDAATDIRDSYFHGANGYMMKTPDWKKFYKMMESFKNYWLETASLSDGDEK